MQVMSVSALVLATSMWFGSSGSVAAVSPPQTGGHDGTGGIVAKNPVKHQAWVPVQSLLSQTDSCPVNIYIQAVLGPPTNNLAIYRPWASNTLASVYSFGKLTNEIGHLLLPHYISQSSELTNWTVQFVLRIAAKDPTFKFTANQIRFVGKSTDAGNSLGKTNTFSDVNLIYSPYGSYGINWSALGPRDRNGASVDTSSYWNASGKNEVIFIGAGGTYYLATPEVVANYINQFPDFQDTGTWQFLDPSGENVLGYANKTLYTKTAPMRWSIAISPNLPDYLRIGINLSATDTGILQWSQKLGEDASWSDTATVNGGDVLFRPIAPFDTGFWRWVLE